MGFMKKVINKEIELYPVGEAGYRVYGNISGLRDELRKIGAIWNKERKAYDISKDSFSKLNAELRDFIIKTNLQNKVNSMKVISELILNENIKLYLKNGKYKVYGKIKPINNHLLNIGFKFEDGNYQISSALFNAGFNDNVKEKVASMNNIKQKAVEELEV